MITETEKRYTDDWAKDKSRELVKKMIAETVLQKKDPARTRVLCFPGIDYTEVVQVYDQLGIPRENVTGIERDKNVAKVIGERCPEINLYSGTLEDFVEDGKSFNFDVVSLDFMGPIAMSQIDVLKNLRRKQKVDEFLFHGANLVRREDENTKEAYAVWDAKTGISTNDPNLIEGGWTGVVGRLGNKFKTLTENSVSKFFGKVFDKKDKKERKANAYSSYLRTALTGLSVPGQIESFRFAYGDKEFDEKFVLTDDGKLISRDLLDRGSSDYIGNLDISNGMLAKLQERIGIICANKKMPKEYVLPIFKGVMFAGRETFFNVDTEKFERYGYISETGAPMIGDIYFVRKPSELIKACKKVARSVGFMNGGMMEDGHKIARHAQSLNHIFFDHSAALMDAALFEFEDLGDRTFLGNSSKPILNKRLYLEAIADGVDDSSVKNLYRSWKSEDLESWRAEYEGRPAPAIETPTVVRKIPSERPGNGELTKENIIAMIGEGIPIDEINKAWPEYGIRTLRAYKANFTRGSYNK